MLTIYIISILTLSWQIVDDQKIKKKKKKGKIEEIIRFYDNEY